LLNYDAQGLWFQDERLLRENKMVLVKWEFVDAILSDIPTPEPTARRNVGFVVGFERDRGADVA
jgi:hypothetical protein